MKHLSRLLFPRTSRFPALPSGPPAVSGVSREKQPSRSISRPRTLLVLAAALLPALPGSLRGQTGETFLTGLDLDALTYNNGVLFWKRDCLVNNPVGRIQRAAAGVPSVYTYYQPGLCDANRVRSLNLATDSLRRVYWATGGGQIVRLDADATPGTPPTVLATMANNTASSVYVAVSAQYVYWAETFGELSESGLIYRAPINGGTRGDVVALTSGGGGGATFLAAITRQSLPGVAATEVVYFRRSFGALQKTYLQIVLPWTTNTISSSVQGVVVADGRLWFAESGATGASIVSSVPLTNTLTKTIHATIAQTGYPEIWNLAADPVSVYWHERRGTSGPFRRCSRTTGAIDSITANLDPIAYQAGPFSDGRHLYWAPGTGSSQTTVKRLAVNSAAVTWNLQADGMELVQAIQSPSRSVPLVENRPGWLRLSGRIQATTTGQTSVLASAKLRGFHNGTELPGSPLQPVKGEQLAYTRPQNRATDDEGWWFHLPASWMRNGLELRGEVNADRAIIETNTADNTVTSFFNMTERRSMALWIHPLRTTYGTIKDNRPEYRPIADLAGHLLPCEDLKLMFVGGPLIEEWQGSPYPWSFGPYELSKTDDDSFWIFLKLGYRQALFSIPDLFNSSSVHHGAFFHSFPNRAFNGKAPSFPNLFLCFLELGGDGFSRPRSAVTLAHELAHNFGRKHVDCGDPADPDPNYPYPPCQLDSNLDPATRHQGFSPFTGTVIAPDVTGDLMSYASPRWTSDYTWLAMFGHLSPYSPLGAGGRAPRSDPPAQKLLVTAGVNGLTPGVLEPALRLPTAEAAANATALVNGAADLTSYQIRVIGAGGTVLQVVPAGVLEMSEPGMRPVFAVIDENPAAQRLELVPTATPGLSLAARNGGGQAPLVAVTAPAAGVVVSGETLAVRWTASDPEGAELRHTVRFSHDGGTSWRVLAEDLRLPELDLPLAGLPGGPPNQALLEVLSTDGLRTSAAQSPLFTVPPAAPQATIVLETPEVRHCMVPNPVVRPDDALVLHGSAQDAEDGPLADEALQWTVTGPTGVAASGRQLLLPRLRPGAYSATLRASDSDATMGQRETAFTVERIRITDLPAAPVLDGVADPSPPAAVPPATFPLPYPNGGLAQVSLARSGSFLYVTISGLALDLAPRPSVTIFADPCDGGEIAPQVEARRWLAYADGALVSERGNGTGWTRDATPIGISARASSQGNLWTAEIQLALSQIGGWNNQLLRLEVAADGYHWFGEDGSIATDLSRWARVEMSADIDPEYDGDEDGMTDKWETDTFGSTSRDGTGDFDGDGQNDRSEFEAGTDPTQSASRFEIASLTPGPEGLEVRWPSRSDRCYDLEISTDLQEFTAIVSDHVGTDAEALLTVPLPEGAQRQLFVRLVARRLLP